MTTLSTETRANAYFDRYACPPWLRAHSTAVGRIAGILAYAHREVGFRLDPEAVALAGFLHDLGKSPLLAGDARPHHDLSALVVAAEGFPQLCELVRRHSVYAPLDPDLAPRGLEERIVYVADRHAILEVVTLEERFREQAARSPEFEHARDAQLRCAREIVSSVFRGLPFGPADLPRLVGDAR